MAMLDMSGDELPKRGWFAKMLTAAIVVCSTVPHSTTLYRGHDFCNDIHRLEASVLAVCGHVAKPHACTVEH